jgi:ferredoxin-NADP reductase
MILTLKDIIERTPDCSSFCFKPAEPLIWQAGQYIQYTLAHDNPDDRGIMRFFTISTAPHEKTIMITTRYAGEKSSSFKKTLFNMEKGDNISALPPQGEFVIDDFKRSYVFVAGGIGITPFRSILLDLEHRKKLKDLQIFLLYANNNDMIVFKDEFDTLANDNPSFKVRYIISPEMVSLDLIKVAIPYYSERTYYISGPPGMVKAVEDNLLADGIPVEQVKLDYFPGY